MGETELLKMHLRALMQRVQMELQEDDSNLAVLFLDPVNDNIDSRLREAYSSIYMEDSYIRDFSCIKDSLNVEKSHQSVGIQIADYIAGSFNALIKKSIFPHVDYGRGIRMFMNHIYPYLRRSVGGDELFGYGIVVVPRRDDTIVSWIRSAVETSQNEG